jgi:uncharacterized protein YndB with AHSA1/START domain/uncharacterized damage-inducible protein DinB
MTRHLRAPRACVYQALLDPAAVQQWMVPDGMTSHVHGFDAREGGAFRISLTYDQQTGGGKTSAQTDTFHGTFVKLVPDTEVVQQVEFETSEPALQGAMTITYSLSDAGDGTDLVGLHENVPPGVSPADNELGWQLSIDKLARLVEQQMLASDPKAVLHRYLQIAREALLWKIDGLSESDVRRPLVPTGTNLLGLVKHVASVEAGYLGETFGRPFGEPLPGYDDDAEPNADMWATADESIEQIVDFYRRVWAHSDTTIDMLELDAIGHVSWWPEDRRAVPLHTILVHMIAETDRHAGHADIVRELIDGAAGVRQGNDNLPPGDAAWWAAYRQRLEQIAEGFAGK